MGQAEGVAVAASKQNEHRPWLHLIGRWGHIVCMLAFFLALGIVCLPWSSPFKDAIFPYALAVVLLVGGFTILSYLFAIAYVSAARLRRLWRRVFGS